MGYRIRQIEADTKFTEGLSLEVITRVIPLATIQQLLVECGVQGQRERRLPGWLTVLFCIGMNLLSELNMTGVMEHLMRGTRLIHALDEEEAPCASAYSQARARLGASVMAHLFKAVCRPLATPHTRGAFAYGLRLVAWTRGVWDTDRPGVASDIFQTVGGQGVNVRMIVQAGGADGKNDVTFTVGSHDVNTVLPVLEEVRKKLGARAFTYDPDVAMLSVVGEGLATSPGTAGRVFSALAAAGVNIDLISTSSITITCVVRQADAERAVRSLHEALELEQEP
jgi:predicted amino acid-binding ACT domain protein